MIGKGARAMLRPASWRIMGASVLVYLVGIVLAAAYGLIYVGVVSVLAAVMFAFMAGYTYRAWTIETNPPPKFGSLHLEGDSWGDD
jgi:hypothetical protein